MTFDDALPHAARIASVVAESDDTRRFVLTPGPAVPAFDGALPGQFVMLSILGHGEAAFTPSALPGAGARPGTVTLTVRRVGSLTSALFDLAVGAAVGLRGPFGRGFPDAASVPTIYVAGGCGLSPLKAAIDRHLLARPDGTPLAVVYGARDPASRIHRTALARWAHTPGVHVVECVEHADARWGGGVGVLIDFLDEPAAAIGARRASVCGPPAMLRPVAERLCRAGLRAEDVHLSIERYMKCGTGHCGHCFVDDRYVCRDGPVFDYAELRAMPDAFAA